jgi:hypothetical protein
MDVKNLLRSCLDARPTAARPRNAARALRKLIRIAGKAVPAQVSMIDFDEKLPMLRRVG